MVRPTTSGSERLFALFSKPLVRMKQMIHHWKSYRRGTSFSYLLFSLIRYGLRAVSNLLNRGILFFNFFSKFRYCFRFSFLTVCRNDACNTPLKSYGRGTTFICGNVFEISYGFKLILEIVLRTTSGSGGFSLNFCEPLVEMIQIICRWKELTRRNFFM